MSGFGTPAGNPDLSPDLNAGRRARELRALADGSHVDVLVVGGGVTGTGVALDAASRGLSVALLERDDLAFGTSRWSSKLVHGGLRYLASGQVGIAYESARERAHLLNTIAPHLVHPMIQVMPVYTETSARDVALNGVGFVAGHLLKKFARTGPVLGRPRWVGPSEARALAPGLRTDGLHGAILADDGQLEDDARLVVAIARTAASFGARIITQCSVDSVSDGGARATDRLTGESFDVSARIVVNAMGVWAGDLDDSVELAPSRGTHVVLRSEVLGNPRGAILAGVPDAFARYVFALPQPGGLTYVGLTDIDEPTRPIPRVPEATDDEVEWILSILSRVTHREVTLADVVGRFAGLRPLVAADSAPGAGSSSADISRRHLVRRTGQLITVTGGKLTTYRRMAQDVVDLITDAPCRTESIGLVGTGAVAASAPARLQRRFGAEAHRVARLAEADPSLLEPLAPGIDVLGVEVVHAMRHEGALSLDDVLERRTRLALVPEDRDRARPRATEILHHVLEVYPVT